MSTTYTTKQGDMWDMIAYNILGSESYTSELMHANPDHTETVIFSAGTTLTIPEVAVEANQTVAPWDK
ncbi:MAG: phage tail protein [Deltaproteobacteria bacterium]|nr:phage tail protein [Deltaproteobacteria bacterium]